MLTHESEVSYTSPYLGPDVYYTFFAHRNILECGPLGKVQGA